MAQYYNLKSDNHISNMVKGLKQFLRNETLCDITLVCEDTSLKAHKIILSAGSSYFQSLISANPCKHPIVVLKDMHSRELKVILDYMYCGQAIAAENQLRELRRVSDALNIKGFKEAVLESYQPDDHQALSRKRRKRRRRTSILSNNMDDGASGESKKSDSDVELLHIIHKESPSSPIENTDEPSNLQDQTTENIPMQSSRSESITKNGNQQPKFSSDILERVQPNLNSGHQIDVNQVNGYDSEIEVLPPDSDIVIIPPSLQKRKPKRDAGKDIVPAEEIGVKPEKSVEKILTTDHTPMLLEDQIPTEDQPAKQCPEKKSLIPNKFGIESSKIEEENLTTDDTTMPFEGQIPTEDQPAKQSPDKKCLVPYEIESSETEEKNISDDTTLPFEGQIPTEDQPAKQSPDKKCLVPYEIESSETEEKNISDDVSTSCADRSFTDIADQQLGCSSDSIPIDRVQSPTENALAIANKQPECSPDSIPIDMDQSPTENSLAIANQQPERSPDSIPIDMDQSPTENSLAIANQQPECSPDSIPIDMDQSPTENSLSIANQQPECSPDDVYDAQAPNVNAEEELPPAKRRKSDESADEHSLQKENMSDEDEFFQESKILD